MCTCFFFFKELEVQFILTLPTFINVLFQEKPYDKDDDILKATSFEVISTLRDVLKTSALWRDHAQTYTQVCSLSPLPQPKLLSIFS